MQTINYLYETLIQNYLLLIESDRQFFSRFNLSQVRFFALVHISQNPAISLTELSKKLLCTKGNTTRIIQGMLSDDLLTVSRNKNDHRATNLHLTEKGQELFQHVQQEFDAFNQQRFSALQENEDKILELNSILRMGLEKSLQHIDK